MELQFKKSFLDDLQKLKKNERLYQFIILKIQHIKSAKTLSAIDNIEKLKKYEVHYRIKIKLSDK